MSKLASFVMEASFYLANWPSVLTKIFPVSLRSDGVIGYDIIHWIRNPKVIFTNAVGWGLIGFAVGLIISAVKGRKRADFNKQK